MFKEVISWISGLLFLLAFVPYIRSIISGPTQPSKASWIIWAVLDIITLVSMHSEGSLNGHIVGATIGAVVVAILSLRYGKNGWSTIDKWCLGGAFLAITLVVFDNVLLGLLTSLLATIIGLAPTLTSAWEDPRREDKLSWFIFWISCILAIIAVPTWTLAKAAQPLTFFFNESIVLSILVFRSRK